MSANEDDDVALKLLHTADWHLGRGFGLFSESDALTLMRARMDAIDALLGCADANRVDAVLAAGDLFDAPDPGRQWWQPLLDKLRARDFTSRPLFLLPGNHDYLAPKSVWHADHEFARGLPPGVHIVDRDDFEHPLGPDGIGVLVARPCRRSADSEDQALLLPARQPGDTRIRVGMVHGSTFEMADHDTNYPIARDAAVRRGLDYLAIGDTHAWRVYPPEDAPTVYPSAPEPCTFAETEAGYAAVVFFSRRTRKPRIRRERVGQWTWTERTVHDVDALRHLAAQDDLRRTVLRLHLSMRVPAREYEETLAILESLRGTASRHPKVGVLLVDDSALQLDVTGASDDLADMPEVLLRTAAELQALAEGPEGEVAQRALLHLRRLAREAR